MYFTIFRFASIFITGRADKTFLPAFVYTIKPWITSLGLYSFCPAFQELLSSHIFNPSL